MSFSRAPLMCSSLLQRCACSPRSVALAASRRFVSAHTLPPGGSPASAHLPPPTAGADSIHRNALPQPPAGITLPLSLPQQAFLAAGSSVLALLNPWRGDMIAVLSETTGDAALQYMRKQMQASAEGREVLALQPRVDSDSVNLERLAALPPNTFGHQYAAFMQSQGFVPEDRAPVRFVADPQLAYVLQRYREAHDFWHVLCAVPTSVQGELALKWLEMLQTGQPMTALAALVGPLRLSFAERAELFGVYVPWAFKCHRSCRHLLSVHYERYLELDIQHVRSLLCLVEPPPPRSKSV